MALKTLNCSLNIAIVAEACFLAIGIFDTKKEASVTRAISRNFKGRASSVIVFHFIAIAGQVLMEGSGLVASMIGVLWTCYRLDAATVSDFGAAGRIALNTAV